MLRFPLGLFNAAAAGEDGDEVGPLTGEVEDIEEGEKLEGEDDAELDDDFDGDRIEEGMDGDDDDGDDDDDDDNDEEARS